MRKLILTSFFYCLFFNLLAQRAIVGAIRWDCWQGTSIANDPEGNKTEQTLSPQQFHYRVPFFGQETGTNSVVINGNTQAIMDQEIAYAKYADIDYWAFVYYPDNFGLSYARKLYNSSSHKSDVKACYILDGNFVPDVNHIDWLTNRMLETNYQKVVSGRPLLYILHTPFSLSTVNSIRANALLKGLPNPYIVEMGTPAEASTIGADAISNYAANPGVSGPFSLVAGNEQGDWNAWISDTTKRCVPNVSAGWDPSPRILKPQVFPGITYTSSNEIPTTAEIYDELRTAINFVAAHPKACEANTVIVYAWNEHDEGGWLCPTITVGNNSVPVTDRITAVKEVLKGYENLALNKTYSSSSNWDVAQIAQKACDGSPTTSWQSHLNCGVFSNQWLSVNFGVATTFETVKLSEYGNRTAGYRIEYSSDGINWRIAYTGTTIGSSKTISFPAVRGNFARIVFTSGVNTPILYEFEIYNKFLVSDKANLALNKAYASSSNWNSDQTSEKAFDGQRITNWQSANTGFANQWLQVDLGEPTTFDKIGLDEYGNRTSGFRIDYSNNGSSWSTAYTGTVIGSNRVITFPSVKGRYARIYFTSGMYTPSIFEFKIYQNVYSSSSDWDMTQTADKAFDGSMTTSWQSANTGFANQWLCKNFGTAKTFDAVKLSEYDNRTTAYRIDYSTDGISWRTAFTGTGIGTNKTITFTAVTANYARLFFGSGSYTPIIYEFEIYKQPNSYEPSNLAANKTYSSSSDWDSNQKAEQAFDNSLSTNWQSGCGFANQWLAVDLEHPIAVNWVELYEYGNRTSSFRIEYSIDGVNWQTAYTGTNIGAKKIIDFPQVFAKYLRLFFVNGSDTPIIYEFKVHYKIPPLIPEGRLISQDGLHEDQNLKSENYLTIFPNPTDRDVSVQYHLAEEASLQCILYDVFGREVLPIIINERNTSGVYQVIINLENLPSGVYFLKMMMDEELLTRKLIISK